MWAFSLSTCQRAQTRLICDHKLHTTSALGVYYWFPCLSIVIYRLYLWRMLLQPLGTSDCWAKALFSAHDHCYCKKLRPNTGVTGNETGNIGDNTMTTPWQHHENDLQITNYSICCGAIEGMGMPDHTIQSNITTLYVQSAYWREKENNHSISIYILCSVEHRVHLCG